MPSARQSLAPTLAALGAAALILVPRTARAEDVGHSVSPGLTFSLSIGDKLAFGLGLDVRYMTVFTGSDQCTRDRRAGLGFFGQATWLNFKAAGRFAAGLQGGGEPIRGTFGTVGEFGWTYRTALDDAHPGGHGVHVGALAAVFPAMDLSIRGTIPWVESRAKPDITIGVGARFPGPFGLPVGTCSIGRPLRDEDGYALPPVLASARACDIALPLDPVTRAALAAAWSEDMRGECASIPAFLGLARDLAAVGAPASLIRRALIAAEDEVRHTASCSALAGDYAGVDLTPALLAPPAVKRESRAAALTRLAVESWQDGCLGEGAAAARARRSFAGATSSEARAALGAIAGDEQRHAELGWAVLEWCVREGGSVVREAVAAEVLGGEPAAPHDPIAAGADFEPAAWAAHGRLDRRAIESTWDETWVKARRAGERMIVG